MYLLIICVIFLRDMHIQIIFFCFKIEPYMPAGRARDLGFDRSMIIGYGQDDRVCAYTSLVAQLALADEVPAKTAVTVLVDKEEIGSVGATGMESLFFENVIAEVMALAGEEGALPLRRALASSSMLCHSFWYTALFAIVSLVLINVLAFAVAYALTLGIKGSNIFRTEIGRAHV